MVWNLFLRKKKYRNFSVSNLQNINSNLEDQENITDIIHHKNYIPFRQEDWLRVTVFIPVMFIGVYSVIIGIHFLFFLIIPGLIVIYSLIQRWVEIRKTKYYLTNKRLIIFDSKEKKIKHSFYYNDFPKMTLRENAYNYGFIILGELEDIFEGSDVPFQFPFRRGINLKDHKIILDNLPNVRTTFELIRNKISF